MPGKEESGQSDLGELEEFDNQPSTPEFWMADDEVEQLEINYSARGPNDWVVSGPLGDEGHGRGRHFDTWEAAEVWARRTYGIRLKARVLESGVFGRWAFLIRGDK